MRHVKENHVGRTARLWAAAVVLLSCLGAAQAQTQRFETVVGGFVGDGLPAKDAALVSPRGIAFDAAGNAYIAQEDENRIRKVSPGGTITTIAGNGTYGFAGDGGPASAAVLASPRGVVVDPAGNVYFSDSLNNRVRKIATNGVISTVAGNGQDNSAGDGGPATSAGLRQPYGLAFDASGNLYVAEVRGHRIRKITPSGIILTVTGTGSAGFGGDGGPAIAAAINQPTSVATDSSGNLYFSDTFNNRIRRVSTNGTISTVTGGGNGGYPTAQGSPAATTRIVLPYGIATDAADNIYIADNTCGIDKVTPDGMIYQIAGGEGWCITDGDGGPAVDANIFGPEGVAVHPNGDVYFTDNGSFIVRKISGGIIDTVVGVGSFRGDGGPAKQAVLSYTRGVTIGNSGEIYVADSYTNGRVRKVGGDGVISTVAGNGVASSDGDGGPATEAAIYYAADVKQDAAGNLYIVDYVINNVRKVAPNGIISTVAGSGIGFGGDGGPATSAQMRRPTRVALDAAGNLYIADYGNNRIRKVGADGIIHTVVGTGQAGYGGDGGPAEAAAIWSPTALAFDAAGNLYIADYGNNRIRKVGTDGIISTVAGNGLFGPAGDGGPATLAALTGPTGVAVDSQGTIYIVGNTLRKVASDGTISTVPGMKFRAYDVAVDDQDAVYVAVPSGRILKSVPARAESDYDGDAVSDLFWRNSATGSNRVWPSADFGSSHSAMAVPDQNWAVAGSGDFDNDGHSDLLWRNGGTGAASVWKSADAANAYYLTTVSDLAWKIAGVGDFDEDGASDILWRNAANGSNAVWRSGDSATQLPIAAVGDQAWQIAGVGDFDGDGRSDVFWRNGATGANAIWKSADQTTAQNLAPVYNLSLKIVGVGDFDGDGKADVLWRNASTGANAIWKSADPATIQSLPSVYDQGWQVYGTGDYDGDGKADILWRHSGTGAATIWKAGDATQLQSVTQVADLNWKIVD